MSLATTPNSELQVIKLSDDFIRILRMPPEAAYSLAPVFASRCDRQSKSGQWISRALIINMEGVLRIFEVGSGRITHAIDFVTVSSDPITTDAPVAQVRVFTKVELCVDGSAHDGFRCVRLRGRCPIELTVDERMMCEGPAKDIWFEDDVLLRFPEADGEPSLGLRFASAIKYFGAQREPSSSFTIHKSAASLEISRQTSTNVASDTMGRKKPNALASAFHVFKRDVTHMRKLGQVLVKAAAENGTEVHIPQHSPRSIGEEIRNDDDAVQDSTIEHSNLELHSTTEIKSTSALLKPNLKTISIATQKSIIIPKIMHAMIDHHSTSVAHLRTTNDERAARLQLLVNYADQIDESRTQYIAMLDSCDTFLRDFCSLVTDYTDQKSTTMSSAFVSLLLVLPTFDQAAFEDKLLDLMYERDNVEEIADRLTLEAESLKSELAVNLVEDPEELQQAADSAAVLRELQAQQNALRTAKLSLERELELSIESRRADCLQTLGWQAMEIDRLRALLKRIKSVFVLHHELVHDVVLPPPSHSNVSTTARHLDMMRDV